VVIHFTRPFLANPSFSFWLRLCGCSRRRAVYAVYNACLFNRCHRRCLP